ncbi:MAG TPA: response regulator transcription factor [Candidatus Didemnitutus sp.]|nr:response regulator transcription factor [Candidatus Didemnitutus sp.]
MNIVVIEDHALMRDLLIRACRTSLPGSTLSGAKDAASGLKMCAEVKPDVIILDLALPDRDGLELLDDLLTACPTGKVVGISGYTDEFTLHRALHSRLHGFVDKNEQTVAELTEAIRSVMRGQRYLSAAIHAAHRSMRDDPVSFDKILSEREQSLLGLFGGGLTNDQVAAKVGLSELTVRNHRCRLMAKLGLRTSPELIRYALEKGFTRSQSPQARAAGRK